MTRKEFDEIKKRYYRYYHNETPPILRKDMRELLCALENSGIEEELDKPELLDCPLATEPRQLSESTCEVIAKFITENIDWQKFGENIRWLFE